MIVWGDIVATNPSLVFRNITNLSRLLIALNGLILCGFWYFLYETNELWIPLIFMVVAFATFEYLIKPKLKSLLVDMYSNSKSTESQSIKK